MSTLLISAFRVLPQRAAQLASAGEDNSIIHSLLQDSQRWATFHIHLNHNITKSKQILRDFKTHEMLHMELMASDKLDLPETLPAIIVLSNTIALLERECGDAISRLEQETKEMIGLVCTHQSTSTDYPD